MIYRIGFSYSYQNKKPALFLDRDGVLIKECHYISRVNQVEIENGAKLVRFAYDYGWHIIVVSNQLEYRNRILGMIISMTNKISRCLEIQII